MNKTTADLKPHPLRAAVLAATAAGVLFSGSVLAGEYTEAMKDAWIDGKLEAAYTLNPHLNAFSIDTRVNDGRVWLSGMVESEIDRQLAEEIAKGITGVSRVENNLKIRPDEIDPDDLRPKQKRAIAQRIDDATTTAAVKSRLMANDEVRALMIDVDTRDDVVILSGTVRSAEEKALAERIAENTDGVKRVRNELVVRRDA